jgi:hypothetical protein
MIKNHFNLILKIDRHPTSQPKMQLQHCMGALKILYRQDQIKALILMR